MITFLTYLNNKLIKNARKLDNLITITTFDLHFKT